jgi:LacI family transcriptional regulator
MSRDSESQASGRLKRITMHDVARRAGVSQPLVSLVIGGNRAVRVSDATRERILQAAQELGYRPNVLARGLVQQRSYSLGIIIPDLRNPFFLDVVIGAEHVAAEEGYALLLCDAAEVPPERHLESLRSRKIVGIIIVAVGAALAGGELTGLNVVLIDEPSETHLSVTSDATAAGRMAAEHLLGLGHRRIGFIGPASDLWAFRMRERGFLQTLVAAGIRVSSDDLRRAAPTVDGGFGAMKAMLGSRPRATAVFCANDLLALGAIKACASAQVAVPSGMSIIGCDDIETARLVTPELTTIQVRAREMGARAARTLIRLLRDEPIRAMRPLGVQLVVRGSTGSAPRTEPTA